MDCIGSFGDLGSGFFIGRTEEFMSGLRSPRQKQLFLVGRDELVAGNAAKHGGWLSEYAGLEDFRGVFLHSVAHEFFLRLVQEGKSFTDDWPSQTSRRKVCFGLESVKDDEGESVYGNDYG